MKTSLNLFTPQTEIYLEQVEAITNLKLNHGKEYPQNICDRCKLDLQQAFHFRERCIRTESYFVEILERKESQPTEEIAAPLTTNQEKLEVPALEKKDLEIIKIKEYISDEEQNFENISIVDEIHLQTDEAIASDNEFLLENPLSNKEIEEIEFKKVKELSFLKRKAKSKVLEGKAFICDQCGNNFQKRQHFLVHLRRHSGEKPFKCEVCPDKFFTQSELNRHMRKHTGERPFACKHCERRFTDYSTRIKHERTHTNERPFACNQCSKAFTTSYILKNHLLTHTGERSFKCEMCCKSFQRQTHLSMHLRSIMHQQNAGTLKVSNIVEDNKDKKLEIVKKEEVVQIDN